MSLIGRMAEAWAAPARSYRAEWAAGAEEPRLLAYAFGASALLTLGAVGAEILSPSQAGAEDLAAWISARLLAGLSFGVLGFYGAAALVRLACRACGGEAGWRATRLAFFWSCFVTAPVAAAALIGGAALGAPGVGSFAAGAVWAALLAPMLAAANGFALRRMALVFIALGAAAALARFA